METKPEYTTATDDMGVPIRDLRTERRFFVDNVIIRGYGPTLGVYGIAVYNALCMHANLHTQQCYPSHRTIADLLDCSVGKVKDAIRLLERLRLIETAPRYDANNQRQTSNLYTILDPPVPPVTTDTPPRYREKPTMNNPHSDQSSLNKEPAAPDSPPADDSWPDDREPAQAPVQEAPEKRLARMRDKLGTDPLQVAAVVEQNRAEATHPDFGDASKDRDAWCNSPVDAWWVLTEKDPKGLTRPTRLKLGGIFQTVGASTGSTPALVAAAIGGFKERYDWWKYGFDWPTDAFCNRLGMMLVPDIEPEPPPAFEFVEPDWLGVPL